MQPNTKIITSPFEPTIQVDSDYKLKVYMEQVYKLTDPEIFIELSNVMSARHNQIQFGTHAPQNINKVQDLLFDLGQKALSICRLVIGEREFCERYEGSLNDFVKLMIDLDQSVANLNLEPEIHGRELCHRLGKFLKIEYDQPSPASQIFSDENDKFNEMYERMFKDRSLERPKKDQGKAFSKKIICIRVFFENMYSAPIRIFIRDDKIELPEHFILRLDESQKDGEPKLTISNNNLKLIATYKLDELNKLIKGFDRYEKGVRFVNAILTKDTRKG